MEARAIAKTLRVSPIKARLVVDLIRGKNVNDALDILNNMNKKPARLTKKFLNLLFLTLLTIMVQNKKNFM